MSASIEHTVAGASSLQASSRASSTDALAMIKRVQRRMTRVSWIRSLLIAMAVAIATWLTLVLLTQLWLPAASAAVVPVALLVGAVVAWVLRRRAGDITQVRAALWLEEQFPSMQFALATLNDLDADRVRSLSDEARARLVNAIGSPATDAPLNRSARRQLLVPVVVTTLLAVVAGPLHALISHSSANTVSNGVAPIRNAVQPDASSGKALANWRVRVVAPAYTGIETRTMGDAGSVGALVGSTIEIAGNDSSVPGGVLRSVADTVKPTTLAVVRETSGWRTQLVMPAVAAEVRLTLGTAARQLLLEPRPDSLPIVQLRAPLRDSVYRVSKGAVALSADAHDDLGLASANFELIVTSGEGERFTAKTVVVAAQKLSGERERHWQASILLDTMKLEPGDIVHMRAVARDRYPEAAREWGASETRTFRIARANEYDSVAVEPAPPPEVQKSLMSQRMLLIMTEKLEQQRPKLTRPALVSESRALSVEQQRLRKMVGDIVFQRLDGEDGAGHEHTVSEEQGKLVTATGKAGAATGGPPMTEDEGDESPIIGVNKPLLEAYNAMWDAGSALDIADPKAAIPHMRLALAAIERARTAERIYLRGKPPVVIIDIAKVRLVGKDTGQINTRDAREPLSLKDAARETRLLNAALLMTRDVSAARDSLAVLRLESLTEAPRLAAALGDALEIARRGGNITDAIIRARRILGTGAPSDSLSRWRGVP